MITRRIEVGGLTKSQLTQKLQQHAISLNEYGERLLAAGEFTTFETSYCLVTVELTVRDLGFPEGATLPELYNQAKELGLDLCPLDAGPYIRLGYLDQAEGNLGNPSLHEAPVGSITIASDIVHQDDDFPKGFYLRKIDGVLWLRGYIADDLHVWNPDDHFIFCQK
jgi:hypothetical protein